MIDQAPRTSEPTADLGAVQTTPPELLTAVELISYLRLDVDDRDPGERLRNLIRRQRLPVLRRGRLQLFRLADVDAWLRGEPTARKTKGPARLVGSQRLTTNTGPRAAPARTAAKHLVEN